ncbi:hypothetical protein C0V77_11075 [Emticicia sp. TH156]|nr:hypothetical protein C0V77_11075 [Emticicia sp. TH156]
MNYIDLVNHFWRLDDGAQFTGWETKLYFYLLKTANGLGWVNEFWHSDGRVSANVGMSINTLKTSRNRLKQAGLINFIAGGKGHGNKTRYQILPPEVWQKARAEAGAEGSKGGSRSKYMPEMPLFMKQNDTGPSAMPAHLHAESTEQDQALNKNPDALPFVEQHRKQAAGHRIEPFTKDDLRADLQDSEICKMAAGKNDIKPEEYALAVNTFVEMKFGLDKQKQWKDISSARENFLYWLPYYKQNNLNKYGKSNAHKTTGRQIVEQPADDHSVVEQGADGVLRRISGTGVQTFAG